MLRQKLSKWATFFPCAAILGLLCIFTGCQQHAYRRGVPYTSPDLINRSVVEPDPSLSCPKAGPGCALDLNNTAHPQAFSLAYLEFDDAGELWSIGNARQDKAAVYPPSQLELAVDLVQRKRQEALASHRPLLVMTFVHGWQNNASPGDERSLKNLGSFKNSLQFLATDCGQRNRYAKNKTCPVVVGIFFAWRGRVIPIDYVHVFSYANRRNVANHVGGPSMSEAVTLLALATKGSPGNYEAANACQPDPDPTGLETHFLVVGHSFGARALEHGVTQSMLSILLERKAQALACVDRWKLENPTKPNEPSIQITPPIDLIAFVNPANDSLEAKSMIEAFKRAGLTDQNFTHPLILSIKSKGDSTTGSIMWLGQSIASGRPTKRLYDRGPNGPTACEQGQLGLKAQSFYYKRSPGGVSNMASHEIKPAPAPPTATAKSEDECSARNSGSRDVQYFWGGGSVTGKGGRCFQVTTVKKILEDDQNAAHFLQRYTDPEIMQFYSCSPDLYDPVHKSAVVPVWNDTPYYVMDAPNDLIRGHDGIFEKGVFNLLLLLSSEQASVPVRPSQTTISPTGAPKALPEFYPPSSAPPTSR